MVVTVVVVEEVVVTRLYCVVVAGLQMCQSMMDGMGTA